ncbi:hypothetical protein GCK72_022496 [Caenorhabditis remanei]|uniref:Collagen IV NC1 domain-containing protein n=1 Tax=Caenorhabditis remanei TaxID=31234 RepID=A0A6A5FU67_CAERE|nr:hypothetical protein GCK72_022496 [Caenorhabditis remanei]KAF1746045.1 hypothetical protein GCK72_022496 [Caenorhabditis remanei]
MDSQFSRLKEHQEPPNQLTEADWFFSSTLKLQRCKDVLRVKPSFGTVKSRLWKRWILPPKNLHLVMLVLRFQSATYVFKNEKSYWLSSPGLCLKAFRATAFIKCNDARRSPFWLTTIDNDSEFKESESNTIKSGNLRTSVSRFQVRVKSTDGRH